MTLIVFVYSTHKTLSNTVKRWGRGIYWFTVYIKKRYFKIDICIESIKSVPKKISIINLNDQKLFIWIENPSTGSKTGDKSGG